MQKKKNQKKLCVFEIIPSKLVALNCLKKRIPLISSQCVNKQL